MIYINNHINSNNNDNLKIAVSVLLTQPADPPERLDQIQSRQLNNQPQIPPDNQSAAITKGILAYGMVLRYLFVTMASGENNFRIECRPGSSDTAIYPGLFFLFFRSLLFLFVHLPLT